jgi:hypothetical protein
MSERNMLFLSGDGMLNFRDYVAFPSASRDMYGVPLIALVSDKPISLH